MFVRRQNIPTKDATGRRSLASSMSIGQTAAVPGSHFENQHLTSLVSGRRSFSLGSIVRHARNDRGSISSISRSSGYSLASR